MSYRGPEIERRSMRGDLHHDNNIVRRACVLRYEIRKTYSVIPYRNGVDLPSEPNLNVQVSRDLIKQHP